MSGWYDKISVFYDTLTVFFYRQKRKDLLDNLQIKSGERFLVIACGTGQSFEMIENRIGEAGEIIGIDSSEGMLRRAFKRIEKHGWKNITLLKADARNISREFFEQRHIKTNFDVVLGELAFTVIPEWKKVMRNSVELLHENGKLGILDWYRPKNDLLGRLVNFFAHSDLTRNVAGYAGKLTDFRIIKTYFFGNIFIGAGRKKPVDPQWNKN